MKFYSHAERDEHGNITDKRELKEHLSEVTLAMHKIIQNSPIECKKELSDIGQVVGLCHDFGKYTTYFQDYLLNKTNNGQKKNHGFISALFSAYQVRQFNDKNKYIPLFVYLIVLHHHGDLKNLDSDMPSINYAKDRIDILKIQIDDIKRNLDDIKPEYAEMDKSIDVEGFIENWMELYTELRKLKFEYLNGKSINDETKITNSLYTLFIYSALIDSDKRDAGKVKPAARMHISDSIVDDYRKIKFAEKDSDPMTAIREGVYNSVVNNIENTDLDKHIFTITAPTGSGKTLAGFSAAVKLRDRLSNDGYSPRIIYALPFTSIIDQNYDVIRDILKCGIDDFEKNENSYLLKHHHLADVRYVESKDEKSAEKQDERPVDEALALIEAWESEIVVTTFIQFFYTLIGYRNRMLKKYHNMAGSIVILDEVQNIPMEYWDDIGKILKYASELLNIYIILMTATKPLLFAEGDYMELVDDPYKYFKDENLNRVCLYPHMEEMSIDEFIEDVAQSYDPGKSYLIVMNTVGSSLDVFDKLKERLNGNDKTEFIYLSANIVPYQRKKRIEDIKNKLKDEKKLVVVSTQVVEAGVDIDMDVVIRDIGPFDSIMQVAGRCNREDKGGMGEVHVYNIIRDSGRHYYERVYKKVHCATSREILNDRDSIEEKEFIDAISSYFVKASGRTAQTNGALVEAIEDLNFNDIGYSGKKNDKIEYVSDFRLIDELPNCADVFIETNDDVEVNIDGVTKIVKPSDIWEYYIQNVIYMKDIKKKRENNLKIKKYFREFIITVNGKYLPKGLEVGNLYRIPNDALIDYYDDIMGYKRARTDGIFA